MRARRPVDFDGVLRAVERVLELRLVVVVFVVSATAPLTESDCALLDSVTTDTDAVIGVVSKIDVHRTWREVLAADRDLVAQRTARYRDMVWVGAAAAPDLGEPVVDDLVEVLASVLDDDTLERRNRLRACDSRLAALRRQRAGELRRFRLEKSERAIELRSQIQHARVQLSYVARTRCAAARTELQEDVASLTRRQLPGFPDVVRRRAAAVSSEIQATTARHLTGLGERLGLAAQLATESCAVVEVGAAPLRSRGAETRLMMLLGVGFGLGVALTLSRVFADLAQTWAVGGAIGGAVVGVAVTLWVVGVRGLLHDRAVLDRWVVEVTAALRTTMEEWVTTRVLAAEASFSRSAAQRDAVGGADVEADVARMDDEIRRLTVQRSRPAGRFSGPSTIKSPDYGFLNRSCE